VITPSAAQELTGTVNGPEGVTSPASMEAAASAGRQQRLTEQVTEDLRVHMSFTQPARVRITWGQHTGAVDETGCDASRRGGVASAPPIPVQGSS